MAPWSPLCAAKSLLLLASIALLLMGSVFWLYDTRLDYDKWILDVTDWINGTPVMRLYRIVLFTAIPLAICAVLVALMRGFKCQLLVLPVFGLLMACLVALCGVLVYCAFSLQSHNVMTITTGEPDEILMTNHFNRLFCLGHRDAVCAGANARQVWQMIQSVNATALDEHRTVPDMALNALCQSTEQHNHPWLSHACAGSMIVGMTTDKGSFEQVQQWSSAHCSLDQTTLSWCGAFMITDKLEQVFSNSTPFYECRGAELRAANA